MDYLNACIGTLKANIFILFKYKKNLVSELIMFMGVYLAILMLNDSSAITKFYNASADQGPILLLIGYMFWAFSDMALSNTANWISTDAKVGLFETKVQSILPYPVQSFLLLLISVLETIIILFGVIIISVFADKISWSQIPFVFLSVVILLPSVVGMFGMGLIFGGFAVKEKSLGNFVNLFAGALIIFSNTLIVGLPKIIYVIPFTSGVDFTSNLYVSGKMDLSILGINLIINAIWLIVGLFFFNYSLKKEKSVGSFDTF
ncbi:ABC transporter [Listeria sp. FSL L7-0229]|uniref:ABC transporter n=1 Tax=Listeria cossartiae TaxID=2838249 RepID=UPI0016268EA4|nr:ABC transporter [Listeria cossartiae]MBC2190719.1 ABC transporter [Listeria cossartiae subsp. cossartiae]